MLERTQMKTLPMVNRVADLAPAAQACCGVCRTCATTNLLTLAAGAGVWLAALGRRALHRRRA